MGKKGGTGGQIAGYRYSLGMLMGVCRGPVDELVAIKVGDIGAWERDPANRVTDNTTFTIDKPDLFGGDEKEGGINGDVDVMMGAPNQTSAGKRYRDAILGDTSVAATATTITPSTKTAVSDGVAGLLGGFGALFAVDATSTPSTTVTSTSFETSLPGATLVSALRGVFTLFFDGAVSANNPYLKKWDVRVRRAVKGWYGDNCWYPEEAIIPLKSDTGLADPDIMAMNPAHIVRQCLTDPVWGRGLPATLLDEDSFVSAANTLCREQFGLCMIWKRDMDIGPFIQNVIDHIGAALYADRSTGLIRLVLIRRNYDPDTLPVFGYDSGLLSIEDDETTSPDNSHSELIVNWVDPVTNNPRQTRVQNNAGVIGTQSTASVKVDYLGLPTQDLAARVAQRDLTLQGSGIKRFKLTFDRRGRRIAPAGVFRLSVPERGIANMVCRAARVEEGDIKSRTVTVTALQDAYALETTSYVKPPVTAHVPAIRTAQPPAFHDARELTYREIFMLMSASQLAAIDATAGGVGAVAAQPTGLATSYVLTTAGDDGDQRSFGNFAWTPTAKAGANVGYFDTSIPLSQGSNLRNVTRFPQAAWIGNEQVEVSAVAGGVATVRRGAVDTIPEPHPAGTRIWFPEEGASTDGREYTTGETVTTLIQTRTNTALLAMAYAVGDSVAIVARQNLPYAPGNFRVNGNRWAEVTSVLDGDIAFTWAHRNRLTQQDHILCYPDGDTAPETGTTYTVAILDADTNALLRETTGITDNHWTYTAAMRTADGQPANTRYALVTRRDGLYAFASYVGTFHRHSAGDHGYGYNYGNNYGGDGSGGGTGTGYGNDYGNNYGGTPAPAGYGNDYGNSYGH